MLGHVIKPQSKALDEPINQPDNGFQCLGKCHNLMPQFETIQSDGQKKGMFQSTSCWDNHTPAETDQTRVPESCKACFANLIYTCFLILQRSTTTLKVVFNS